MFHFSFCRLANLSVLLEATNPINLELALATYRNVLYYVETFSHYHRSLLTSILQHRCLSLNDPSYSNVRYLGKVDWVVTLKRSEIEGNRFLYSLIIILCNHVMRVIQLNCNLSIRKQIRGESFLQLQFNINFKFSPLSCTDNIPIMYFSNNHFQFN